MTPASGGLLIAHSPELSLSSTSMHHQGFKVSSRRDGRPVRSKRVKNKPLTDVFIDSSTLRIDSEDEGGSISESDDSDLRPKKKIRIQGPPIKLKQEDEDEDKFDASQTPASPASTSRRSSSVEASPEPQLNPWDLRYYPATHSSIEKFKKILGAAPPDTDDLDAAKDAVANTVPAKRGIVAAPKKQMRIVTMKLPPGTIDKNASHNPNRAGFMDLPGELRNQVYMLAFKSDQQIDFKGRKGFSRSAGLLRANKAIYNEARNILYGENRFVFDQSTLKVGEYYELDWKEINYAHVRKFLTAIGPENTGFIRNVGLCLEDATPSGHPNKDIDERRFENNKDLYWILKYLGRHGKIEKLKLGFAGRRCFHMHRGEAVFLYALAGVKTDELSFGHPTSEGNDNCRWHRLHYGKLSGTLEHMLLGVMVRPVPLAKMHPRLKF